MERADVRIISASTLSVDELKRKLYPPFFYRISKLKLSIPPLREREIEKYIYYFFFKEIRKSGKELELSESAMEFLKNFSWEGNLRELQSTIHSLVLMKEGGAIERKDILEVMKEGHLDEIEKDRFQGSLENRGLRNMLLDFEREVIIKALEESEWNLSKASKRLKISRQNLQYKIKKL